MRASPPFQITLERFAVWQAGVVSLGALCAAGIMAWFMSVVGDETPPWQLGAAAGVALLGLGCGVSLTRMRPTQLRWDGQRWHKLALGTASQEPVAGGLTVTVDLGTWLLLRFVAEAPQPASWWPWQRREVTWLPVQRRGAEAQWHALRCAVYSPRPSPGSEPPAAF